MRNFDKMSLDWDPKFGNFIWLQLILGQKPCFLGPRELVTQKVNIHYNTYRVLLTVWIDQIGQTLELQFAMFVFQFCMRVSDVRN